MLLRTDCCLGSNSLALLGRVCSHGRFHFSDGQLKGQSLSYWSLSWDFSNVASFRWAEEDRWRQLGHVSWSASFSRVIKNMVSLDCHFSINMRWRAMFSFWKCPLIWHFKFEERKKKLNEFRTYFWIVYTLVRWSWQNLSHICHWVLLVCLWSWIWVRGSSSFTNKLNLIVACTRLTPLLSLTWSCRSPVNWNLSVIGRVHYF